MLKKMRFSFANKFPEMGSLSPSHSHMALSPFCSGAFGILARHLLEKYCHWPAIKKFGLITSSNVISRIISFSISELAIGAYESKIA